MSTMLQQLCMMGRMHNLWKRQATIIAKFLESQSNESYSEILQTPWRKHACNTDGQYTALVQIKIKHKKQHSDALVCFCCKREPLQPSFCSKQSVVAKLAPLLWWLLFFHMCGGKNPSGVTRRENKQDAKNQVNQVFCLKPLGKHW